jgi:hypothetical protein
VHDGCAAIVRYDLMCFLPSLLSLTNNKDLEAPDVSGGAARMQS